MILNANDPHVYALWYSYKSCFLNIKLPFRDRFSYFPVPVLTNSYYPDCKYRYYNRFVLFLDLQYSQESCGVRPVVGRTSVLSLHVKNNDIRVKNVRDSLRKITAKNMCAVLFLQKPLNEITELSTNVLFIYLVFFQ